MKTIHIKIIILLIYFSWHVTSKAQETKAIGEFNAIRIKGFVNVIISQNNGNSISYNSNNSQPKITTEIKEGILNITADNSNQTGKPEVINVSVKKLDSLMVYGLVEVKTSNPLICGKLFIESQSTGNVYINVNASEITTHNGNVGDITLTGTTQILNAHVSGSGDLRASNLEVDTAKIKVSGTGSAKINVKHNLQANVAGTGSVIYKGKPVERNISISGTGSVRESKSGNGEETASDTSRLKSWKKKYLIVPDDDLNKLNKKIFSERNRAFKHWTGFEVGVNGLLDYKNSLDPPSPGEFLDLNYQRSLLFGLNLLEKDFHLYKNYLKIVTGFGFEFNHYALQKKIILIPNDTAIIAIADSLFQYKKNTLNISYIKVPVMLEVNTSKNSKKNTHIDIGAEFAYRIHTVLKQKKELNDKHYKTKQRDDFNLEPFRVSAIARIGYNNVTAFATYPLNRLFKKNKGPQVYPFSIGIAFNFN